MRTSRPPPAPPAPPPHSRFGPYTLVDRLAVGGMAELFRALEPRPAGEARVVVVKRMLPSIAAERGSREMFRVEADLGARVQHPNVVEVLGGGQEEGQPFVALEYVRGVDLWRLTRWLTRQGTALGVPLTLYVMEKLLAGLEAIHEARDADGRNLGIVHRDVSPSNILLSVHGAVKVGDFGIAYARMREQLPQAPLSERAKGKLGYLAPEQVAGQPLDRRADVFSAGVIAAELLMGRPLFAGGSELAVLLAIRDAKVRPFQEIVPTLPAGLGDAVLAALARDPDERIGTAAELAERLAPFQTEDPQMLRLDLSDHVKKAARSSTLPGDLPTPGDIDAATPLRQPHDPFDRETPLAGAPLPGGPGVAQVPETGNEAPTVIPPAPVEVDWEQEEGPITADVPTVRYEVHTTTGQQLGPLTYAQVVEAVATGEVGPFDRVRPQGGDFERVEEVTSLARHLPPSSLTPVTRNRETPGEADEVVPLAHGGITTALGWTTLRADTGLWLCELGGVRKEVYVKDGVPEFVTSNLAGELLGEYLVGQEVISRGELDMALAVMPRFEGRLGDTLTALGLVEPVHLFRHIAGQVRDKLLDLFLWEGGQASLYLGVPPPSSAFPLGLDPWAILMEGVGRRLAHGLEDDRFAGQTGGSLRQAAQAPPEVFRADLPADAQRMLSMLSMPRTLSELTEAFDEPTGDASRSRQIAVLLFHLNAVEWC